MKGTGCVYSSKHFVVKGQVVFLPSNILKMKVHDVFPFSKQLNMKSTVSFLFSKRLKVSGISCRVLLETFATVMRWSF